MISGGTFVISRLAAIRATSASVGLHTSVGRPVRHRRLRNALIDANKLYDFKTVQLDEDEPDVPVTGSFTRRAFGDADRPVGELADRCSDEPIQLPFNPYSKEPRKCVLCKHNIKLDYKNTRLLQQFVSSFSGRIYERHVTGLCKAQQAAVVRTIALSRKAGLMPILTKDPKFLNDPKLFDPLRPISQHSFD